MYLSSINGTYWTHLDNGLSKLGIYALAINDTNIYAGTSNGGVFLSNNNGTSWTQKIQGMTNAYINSIAVSGTNIFAGSEYSGIFFSPDNGVNWSEVNNGLTNREIQALLINGDNIYAGTNGGVFLSTNNGTNWSVMNSGLNSDTYIYCFAKEGSNIYAGTRHGVFMSNINDSIWVPINNGLTYKVNSLAIKGTNIFAGVYGGGIYLLTDTSANWVAINNGITNNTINDIAISGNNILAVANGDIFLSNNNGTNWTDVNNGLNAGWIESLAINGTDIYIGAYNGVYFSSDTCATWTPFNTGLPPTYINHIATNGSYIFAGTDGFGVWKRPLYNYNACNMYISPSSIINESTPSALDGAVNIYIHDGTPPYHFTWSNSDTIQNISGLASGYYDVIVTDSNNCQTIASFFIRNLSDSTYWNCNDTLNTNTVDTCFSFIPDTAYIYSFNFPVSDSISVKWIVFSQDTSQHGFVTVTYSIDSNGCYIAVLSIECAKNIISYFYDKIYIENTFVTQINTSHIPFESSSIYPNPSNDKITIDFASYLTKNKLFFSIYNIHGQLLLKQPLKQEKTEIDISNLAKGIYILRLNNNEKTEVVKFVKE